MWSISKKIAYIYTFLQFPWSDSLNWDFLFVKLNQALLLLKM